VTPPANRRIPCAVLGATGVVGQRLVARLARHPWFEIAHLCASEKSAGKRYADACEWHLGPERGPAHGGFGERIVEPCDPGRVAAPLVFSALDTEPARELEPAFARAGSFVASNASAFRMAADVPIVIPELNAAHLDLVLEQRRARGWRGAIVCKPNCTTVPVALPLGVLDAAFGVEAVHATSLQAVSGAGWPGVSSLDILGNVVPFIRGEEEKLEQETVKLLGRLGERAIEPAAFPVSAACHRVPVEDGHMVAVSVKLRGAPTPEAVRAAFEAWRPSTLEYELPSAPARALVVHSADNRPQPKLDAESHDGMSVHVGRVRRCAVLGIQFSALVHNAERGAAGGNVLYAELARARGLFG
jgi:aspartate-semialdehyde dehydrogenase